MKIIKTSLKILIVLLLLAIAGIAFLLTYQKTFHNTFPPNTIVSGLDIGGQKSIEAKNLISQKISEFQNQNIVFKFNDKTTSIKAKDLPIIFLADQTLSHIEIQDLSGNFLSKLLTKSPENKISLIVKVDNLALENMLLDSFTLTDIGAKNANYGFNEKNTLIIKEELSGFKIDGEIFYNSFKENARNLQIQTYEISLIEENPIITKADLEEQLDDIKAKLQNKITLIDPVFSDDWYIKLIDYPTWVSFVPDEENKTIKIQINKDPLNEYIDEKIAKWLDRPAEDVNIKKNAEDKIEITGKGIDGTKIKRELFQILIEYAANAKKSDVLIPIEPLVPIITVSKDLADLGIKERLGIGHTSYYGSPTNRIHNIKVGAEKFNGKLIAPGETFSFNKTLGRVDGSTGYRKELVIKKEGTIPEFGGGLCQVSTTVYRAILFSGLAVADRRAHTYAVSYYSQILGHGLDATIYLGGQDLKFVNDTNHHVLIQAFVDGNYELYITFYGTNDGRTIEMEGPYLSNYHSPGPTEYITTNTLAPGAKKQVEKNHVGFNALWYRHITKADGTKLKETIKSAYRAVPAKILVGAE